jgi:RNA polymerase sigma-70 factor (ECF subfamily)
MLSEHELYQQRLIDRCTKGDRVAQQEIYQLYYKVVYNTCFRILGNRVEAEDAMQEAFLSAFHRLRFFRGEASFSTWLRRIAVNRSIDMLRSQKTRFAEFNEATCGLETDYVDEAVDDENNLKLIEQVKAAMEQLPKGLKVVFSLALFEGYDHEEIGEILGIAPSTSRSQLARAKKKICQWIESQKRTSHL